MVNYTCVYLHCDMSTYLGLLTIIKLVVIFMYVYIYIYMSNHTFLCYK